MVLNTGNINNQAVFVIIRIVHIKLTHISNDDGNCYYL